jgi:hypothetical protein
MNNVLQSDVFFFISSVSVVFITILLIVALAYVISILKDIRGFLNTIRTGTDALAEDVAQVREKLNSKGIWTGILLSLIAGVTGFAQRHEEVKKKGRRKGDQ